MTNAIMPPPEIPGPLVDKLSRLRRGVTSWLAIDGLRRLLIWTIGLGVLDVAIDYRFHLDMIQRVVMLLAVLGVLAYIFYRHIITPLQQHLSDDALCLEVEHRNQALGESLISALQFSRGYDAEAHGVSAQLVRATIDRGAAESEHVEFSSVLDRQTFLRNLVLAGIGLLLLLGAGVSVASTDTMRTWFSRNLLLGSKEWPQDTVLNIKGVRNGRLLLPRGDDWDQVVDVTGRIPDVVELDYQPHGSSRSTEPMTKQGDRQFHATFKNVLSEFRFRVRGGDAQSSWIEVELIDRPSIADLKLDLVSPAYMQAADRALPPGRGPYDVYPGSSIKVHGVANKPLANVRLLFGDHDVVQAKVDGKAREFDAQLNPSQLASRTYSIELTDTDQWSSKHATRFTLKMKPDREPVVKASPVGISSMIVPGARIPLNCQLSDDFAVTSAKLLWNWHSEGTDQTSGTGEQPLTELEANYNQPKVGGTHTFDTEPLKLPIGGVLAMHVEARDNDVVSGDKVAPIGKVGKSDDAVLKIVSTDELRAELLRREKEQRLEVERLLKDEDELVTDTRAVQANGRDQPALVDADRKLLETSLKKQMLCADRCKQVATHMESIVLEMQNNRLEEENGALKEEFKGNIKRIQDNIIKPLNLLSKESVPQATALLDTARRNSKEAKPRDIALQESVVVQERMAKSMRDILKYMAKTEGYQEIINQLYAVIKSQSEVAEPTAKEAHRRINELINPPSDKPDDAKPQPGKP